MIPIDEQLARYGLRLGIVEPLFLQMACQIPELDAVVEELRAKRDFALSDRVRAAAKVMRDATEYAFPRGIPSKGGDT